MVFMRMTLNETPKQLQTLQLVSSSIWFLAELNLSEIQLSANAG